MRFRKLLVQILIPALLLPFTASALVMRANGPEPVIVQIKESLRASDDLDNRLNDLSNTRQQNGMIVVKWWAGRKLLVMLSFPSRFSQQQAMQTNARLQQHPAVEKVVPVSAYNLEFKPGDFVRSYGPTDSIPDVARRGFDADRIGKTFPLSDQYNFTKHPHAPNRIIVRWKEELIWKADQTGFSQRLANFHRAAGCRVTNEFRYSPTQLTQVLEFDDPATLPDKLRQYMNTGWSVYVEPDYLVEVRATPNDPGFSGYPGPQWSLNTISAPQAWNLTTGDSSVILAVGDTGANVHTDSTGHPDFSSNLWWGQNDPSTGQHNFIYGGTNVDDDNSVNNTFHGSNVGAIIGAQGNNGMGITGVSWATSLMILKVVDGCGGGCSGFYQTLSAIENGIQYAWQHGATAINLSLGFYQGPFGYDCRPTPEGYDCNEYETFERTLVDSLRAARNNGMVVVCAVGNSNDNDDWSGDHPAGIPTDNNIAVMATDRYDNRAPYSSYGGGRVDLAAPGGTDSDRIVGLRQTWNGNSYDGANYSYDYGTSMATPHVTGAIGLIKSRFPWEDYRGLRDRVLMGVDHTGTLNGLCRTEGRLNVFKALQTRSMIRNLSTRARVEGGDRVMIGGFVIGGSPTGGQLKVAIRGLGPSLVGSGVTVPLLVDPTIHLEGPGLQESEKTNNNWYEDSSAPDLEAIGLERVMHFNADKSVLFTYDQALRLGWDKKYSRPEEPRPITRVM